MHDLGTAPEAVDSRRLRGECRARSDHCVHGVQPTFDHVASPGEVARKRAATHRIPPCRDAAVLDRNDRPLELHVAGESRAVQLQNVRVHGIREASQCCPRVANIARRIGEPIEGKACLDDAKPVRKLRRFWPHRRYDRLNAKPGKRTRKIDGVGPHATDGIG